MTPADTAAHEAADRELQRRARVFHNERESLIGLFLAGVAWQQQEIRAIVHRDQPDDQCVTAIEDYLDAALVGWRV